MFEYKSYKYIKITGHLPPSAPKGNSKFEILLIKKFSLKQKQNKMLTATREKIKFCVSKKSASIFFRLKFLILCKR